MNSALSLGNLTIQSSDGALPGNGDINIDDALSWNTHALELIAADNININAAVTVSGSGALALNPGVANGTDTAVPGGTTIISATGTLTLGGSGGLLLSGLTDNGVLDISGRTTGGVAISSLAGNGAVILGGNTLTLLNAVDTFSGIISGSGGLTLDNGTETLSGLNIFDGGTEIESGGTLALAGSGSIAASSGVDDNGIFDISGATGGATITSLSGNGVVNLGTNTLTLSDASGTFAGGINGSGGLTLEGGTETLSGLNTFSGGTDIGSGGTLALSGSGSIAGSSSVNDDGIFDISGTTGGATITSLSGNGVVNLGANTLTLSNASGTFAGGINGSGGLTLDGGTEVLSGINTFDGGATVNVGTLLLSSDGSLGTGGVTLDGGTLENTASFTLNRSVTVGPNGGTLQTDAGTNLTISQAIGGSGSLTQNGAGTLTLEANVVTGGSQTYNGLVALQADVTTSSTGGGDIDFASALDGAQALVVNTSGMTTFGATVGGTTALASLTTDAGGGTTLAGNVNTTGAQTYNDAVSLGADVTATSTGGGSIAFNSTVDGAHDLTINTGGQTIFDGAIGGTTALSSLTTDAGGSTLLGASVTTTGAQTYDDAVTLAGNVAATSSGGGSINFASTLDGAHALVVNTSGIATFGATVGGATALASLTTDAGGSTMLGGNVSTTGAQTYNDAVSLGADVIATSSGDGSIAFSSTVDGAHNLAINTGGQTTFGGAVGGSTTLVSLTTDAGGSTLLGGNVSTTGAQTYNDAVALGGDVTATSSGSSAIAFSSTVDGAHKLTINTGGQTTFGGALGGATALTGLAVDTGTFSANALRINGNLELKATGGAIVQGDSWTVAGTSSIDAGGNAITLTSAGNDFNGAVALTGGNAQIMDANALTLGTLSTGALTANSTGALDLGSGTVNGNLSATSNGGAIGQSGALNVGGTSDINAGTGSITLINAGNDFIGAVSATGTGISISDANDLNVASLIDGGNGSVSLVAGGNLVLPTTTIDTGTGDLTLAANGGTLATSGDLSGNNVSLTGRDGMTLAGDVTALDNVTLNSGGTMLLTGNLAAFGTTTIDSGTLQVGNGTVGGSISGDVVDNGTLTFDLGSATLNGATFLGYGDTISGSGSLRAINTSSVSSFGFLTLSGQNTFSGGTEVGGTATGETNEISVIADNVDALGTGAVTVNQPGDLRISGSGSGDVFSNALSNAGYTQFGNLALGSQTVDNGGTFGVMDFSTGASAGNATLVNTSILSFDQDSSAGSATIRNSGSVNFSGTSSADNAVIQNSGEVGIGNSGDLSIGSLSGAGSVQLGAGTLILGGLNLDDTISGDISDGFLVSGGSLAKTGTGTLTLDGNNTFTGGTEVRAGTLIVGSTAGNGASLAGDVAVDDGATLGGHGTIGGNVDLASGAHLAPGNSIGTLTVEGDFTAEQGSVLDYEFGAPGSDSSTFGTGDSVSVGGNLELDGATLNVADAGGFGPGLYNVFSYGGTLTESNGGLSLDMIPAGATLQLQYLAADKQINLLDTTGYTLNFWNGNGLATSAQLGGGDGIWSTTSQVWTDAAADTTAAMQPQPGFAIFGGAAGTVTVDNSGGDVSATGMQFASDGYVLTGDTLTLVGSSGSAPIIRVGDGSSAGAGMTATIDNTIAGSDGLVKSDLGTLVLAGANTFSGGVGVDGGTLSVAGDGNLGDAANAVTFDGGVLENTAAFTTARDFVLQGDGALQNDADLTIAGTISGSGALAKDGAGTLVLTGDNTFSGGTTISAGTLQIGNGGASGSLVGDVANDAALVFDRSDAFTFAGRISGSGSLTQQGGGSLILTGANTFSGGTTISAGTLQIGNGGASGSLVGDVADDAALVFDRSDAFIFAGTISGSGSLTQQGDGSLILTGANTFSGGTIISAGTLQVGSGGTSGSIAGDVADAGALVFDRGDDVSFAGVISGSGSLTQQGSGTLTLTGSNTFSGGLAINGGTLSVSSDANLGDAGNTLTLDGGTLENSAAFTTARDFLLQGDGALQNDADLTIAGTISGSGALIKDGAGTLTLDGASLFAGSTTVQSGMLVVGDDTHAGASLGGSVVVDDGTTLGGQGTIGGLDAFGTVSPGGSIGTLRVAGDAVFEQGSTFQVEVNAAGANDQLAATGTVSIKGGNTLVIAQGSGWAPRTDYTIISADGGVGGQFTSVSDNLAFLDPVLVYLTNSVELSLQRNDLNFTTVATTPNENGVAGAANGLGWNSPLYNALVLLGEPTARSAFDQLSGELHASQQTARVDDSRFVREAMDQRLQEGGSGALDAWAHAWGHWGSVDGDGNAAKLSNNGDGLLVGADLPVGAQGQVGLTGGSARNSLSVQDRNSWGRTTSTWLGVYGGLGNGPFALRAGVAYAWDRIPVDRQVEFPGVGERLSSNATGNTLTGFIEGAWKIQTTAGEYEPYLNFAHVRLNTGATTEAGGDAALHVSSENENVSFSTLGARGSWQLGGTQLHGGIGWQHAFGDTTPQRTLQFLAGGDAFTVYGVPVAQNAAVVNLGADWKLTSNVKLDASYNGQWASSARDQAAKLSLSVAF